LGVSSYDVRWSVWAEVSNRKQRQVMLRCCGLVGLMLLAWGRFEAAAHAENWPGWRGPRGDGTSLESSVPVQWNAAADENVAWKVPLPGSGHASPIIFGERVFIVACLEETQERVLFCLDRQTG